MSDPAFPSGRREPFEGFTPEWYRERITELAALPEELLQAVSGLRDEQLDTPYREGGWTVRQIVHHLAAAHMMLFIVCRYALAEDDPVWPRFTPPAHAELPGSKDGPTEPSLRLVENLHERWVLLFESLSREQFERVYFYPSLDGKRYTVAETLHNYAFHGRNHVAQITSLRERKGW